MGIESAAEKLRSRVEASGFDRSVKFDTGSDGVIVIDGSTISTTDAPADCTIRLSLDDLESLIAGELNPTATFRQGRWTVEGDVSVAMAISKLLRRPLTDTYVSKLGRMFGIPPERVPFFRRMLICAINEAWFGNGTNRGMPRSGSIVRLLEQIRSASCEDAMKTLEQEKPDAEAAQSLLMHIAAPLELSDWWEETDFDRRSDAITRAQRAAEKHFRSAGRTPGTKGRPGFDLFVQQLYYFVKAAGGDPGKASKKGRSKVSGVMFREVIPSLERAGQLPKDFVPETENSKLKVFAKAEREFSNTRF